MIPCRCNALNTLAGDGAEDYAIKHLDLHREDARGRATYSCRLTDIRFVLEPAEGRYDGLGQRTLRRLP